MPSRQTRYVSDDEDQCSCDRCSDPATTADAVKLLEYGCSRTDLGHAKPKVKVPTKPKKKRIQNQKTVCKNPE